MVENASGYDYHSYHAFDFSKVDARYESEDVSFETLLEEVHSRDMKLILDVVFNHTGNFGERNLFPMFEKSGDLSAVDCMKLLENSGLPSDYASLSGSQQYDARIANMKNTKNDGSDPNDIYHHYGNFSWETFGEQVAQIAGDCVDLNTENPIVAEYLVKCYGDFIRMGVDYFRIDTMKHISRLTLNNYLLPGLYEYARRCGNDHFYMFGEVCARVREVWNHGIPALSAPFYTWKETKAYPWGDKETNLASIEQAYTDNSTTSGSRLRPTLSSTASPIMRRITASPAAPASSISRCTGIFSKPGTLSTSRRTTTVITKTPLTTSSTSIRTIIRRTKYRPSGTIRVPTPGRKTCR